MTDRESLIVSLAMLCLVIATVVAYHHGRDDEMRAWWARVERGEFRLVLPEERHGR